MSESINEVGLNGFTGQLNIQLVDITWYGLAIVRTVPDLLTYRQRYMEYLFGGSFNGGLPTIEFQPIDLYLQSPNVQARSAVGFPQTIPISIKTTKGRVYRHLDL